MMGCMTRQMDGKLNFIPTSFTYIKDLIARCDNSTSFSCVSAPAPRGSSATPLIATKGGSWIHPSIVDGGMDGRVDGMKKTSFHHEHNVLYIY